MRIRPTAVVLALALATLAGCGDDAEPTSSGTETGRQQASRSSNNVPTEETQEGVAPAPSTVTSAPGLASSGPGQVTVPVYFVGSTPQGKRLFREFQRVSGDDPLLAAADAMTAGDALDPDYGTLFPGGSFASVTEEPGAIVVEVADDGWSTRAAGMSRREARLAAQQLVYTVQGVAQSRLPVRVEAGGEPVPLFGIDTAGGLRNAGPDGVLAFVNVTTPEQGATVGSPLVASGVANSFEANVPWEIRDGSGAVVKRGFTTAEGWGNKLYPWRTKINVSKLPAGDYTFVAMTDDPSGGEGGGPTEDSKDVTIG
ncbi:Gmad2 immunoglobulin-like domain-containing protein [Nocardioides taihuensis]|uniref:Gmad2 immunoglobulin-like domain-containing protein n=1 Tax=Nocardioides taihuensis TaxID=1835606 RepID=A0ABW0BNC3_9ACTN